MFRSAAGGPGRAEQPVLYAFLTGLTIRSEPRMFVPDETVEAIRTASDIVDVVGERVRLKQKGTNYFGLCPFHTEKTPSFSVNPELGIFKCFGCGAGGDVFQFVMRAENLSFPETLKLLADRAGIELPQEESDQERLGETESIVGALRFAARLYYRTLTQTAEGKHVLEYLRARGFSGETIKKFGLGYSSDSWDGLLRAARQNHVSEEVLEKAGLIIQRKDGSGYYDRFRGRVMFPIISHVGKVLGFGGRILTGETDQPKYINSPETQVYNKSRVLYGLYQARHAIRKREEAILVEGYTDVISLHQAGIEHAVASSGTSLTKEQVALLSRYAKRILLVFDSDAAGMGAALRAIDLILPAGLSAYIVELPPGEDPDSFARKGAGTLESFLEKHRSDFISYIQSQAQKEGKLNTPEGEAETTHGILHAISSMPDPLMQESYLKKASEVLRVPDIRLHEVLSELVQTARAKERRKREPAPLRRPQPGPMLELPPTSPVRPSRPKNKPLPEEKTLIRLMLEHGTSMVEFILGNTSLEEFTPGPARHTAEQFLKQYESGKVDRQAFLDGSCGEDVQQLVAEVSIVQHEPSGNWERKQRISVPKLDEDPYESAVSAMMFLKLDRIEDAIKKKQEEIQNAQTAGADARILHQEWMALQQVRGRITRKEFLEEE